MAIATDHIAIDHRTHGVHVTGQLSVRVDDLSLIADAMARLRARVPATLAGVPVAASDLAAGVGGLPPTDAILLAGDGVRAVARPSGTEPKLKVYLEAALPPEASVDLGAARATAQARLALLRADMAVALGLG